MVCQKLAYAGIMPAAVATARGQSSSARAAGVLDLSKLSSEHVIFLTGKVMLDDGSVPADFVRIERVCDGRTPFRSLDR